MVFRGRASQVRSRLLSIIRRAANERGDATRFRFQKKDARNLDNSNTRKAVQATLLIKPTEMVVTTRILRIGRVLEPRHATHDLREGRTNVLSLVRENSIHSLKLAGSCCFLLAR